MASVIRVNTINSRSGLSTVTFDNSGAGVEVAGIVTATSFSGSITDTGLTAGRVTYAGSGGELVDSGNLTFNGSDLLIDASTNAYKGVKFDNSFNLTFGSSSGTSPRLYLKGTSNSQSDAGDTFLGTGTGGEQWFQSNTFTAFKVNADSTAAEALRISSGGYVGVKRSTPLANLHTTNNELAIGANPTSAAAPNATYDGLVVDGEAGSFINIRSRGDGNSSYGRLAFSDDVRSRAYVEYRHKDGGGDDTMRFATAGSERLRIDASGQATHIYDIASDGDAGLILNTDDGTKAPSILFRANSENRARLDVKRRSGDGGIVTLQVSRADNSNNLVNVFTSQCATSGDTTPDLTLGGNLVLASGHGIDFSATSDGTTKDNELFDDYEEGYFTPTWYTESSLISVNYHTQKGFYVKIGRMVYFQVYIRINSKSGGSGSMAVYGLPFTSQDATSGSGEQVAYGGLSIAYTNSWQGDTVDRGLVSSSSTKCYVYCGVSGGTNLVAGAGNLGNGTQFRAFGSYVAA